MPNLLPPKALIFDWQNTLASTMDALYNAMDDTLTLLKPSTGLADNTLGNYVKQHHKLPDSVKQEKKMSRTDLFDIIFDSPDARESTNDTFNVCYSSHYEDVHALDTSIEPMLRDYKKRGIKLGIVSNRLNNFLTHELAAMGWDELFQVVVAAGDGCAKKPSPEPMLIALDKLREKPGHDIWYMGDGKSDMQCAVSAGVGAIFYNFAKWNAQSLSEMFITPGTRPDEIVDDYKSFRTLVERHLG